MVGNVAFEEDQNKGALIFIRHYDTYSRILSHLFHDTCNNVCRRGDFRENPQHSSFRKVNNITI